MMHLLLEIKRFSTIEGDVNKAIMDKHLAENAFDCENGINAPFEIKKD